MWSERRGREEEGKEGKTTKGKRTSENKTMRVLCCRNADVD